jgi:Cu+-exporting ATPase
MKVKDPICGMMVDTDHPPAKGTYDGRDVYFCSASCKAQYEARQHPSGR